MYVQLQYYLSRSLLFIVTNICCLWKKENINNKMSANIPNEKILVFDTHTKSFSQAVPINTFYTFRTNLQAKTKTWHDADIYNSRTFQ